MAIQFNQDNPFQHFNTRFVSGLHRSDAGQSLHARRRMMEAQDEAKATESMRVTLSAEAMALERQAKALERLEQYQNVYAEETQDGESGEPVQLTEDEIYQELLNQVGIWGDKSYALRHDFNHQETAEMAEKRAAALSELQQLEELHKSETVRLQRDAQKAAEQASMQQEEINRKSSELIMMIESFEDADKEEADAADGEDSKDGARESAGSLMEGEPGAMAARGEMGFLDTVNGMEQSSTQRIAASDHSINAVEAERRNIYRANDAKNFTMQEKIAEMSNFICAIANNEDVKKSFKDRIEQETDPTARKKLQAMMEYFDHMEMRNGYRDLKQDREFALQERITARDLRIAHLGSRHFAMAEQQQKELQSLFDEDDILRVQGQNGVTSRTEEVAERLQDTLDDRDHIDEDSTPEEEITGEEQNKDEETLDMLSQQEQSDAETGWNSAVQYMMWNANRFADRSRLPVSESV